MAADGGRWIPHSRMTDPGEHAATLGTLPRDPSRLARIVAGLLVHCDCLAHHGLEGTPSALASRTTLPVAARLTEILRRDVRPLSVARSPEHRAVGTCRDFALLLCAILRQHGVPARLRCGFAAYLGGGWEDHWLCESWDGTAARWVLADAQDEEILRDVNGIDFDPADVPERSFLTAGRAWAEIRDGRADPARFGHGATTGLWFVKVNVLRDHGALNGRELSAWDGWRKAAPERRVVVSQETAMLDRLAARPEDDFGTWHPDWLT